MPSIDDFKFKKKTYRGWDNDIFSKLKISSLNEDVKLEPNISQTKVNKELNQSQTKAKPKSNQSQIYQKSEPELRPIIESNISHQQTKSLVMSSQKNSFMLLVGLQKKLTLYIYELCKLQRDKTTMPVSIENAAIYAETTISSTRKALQRLEIKGIITRKESKSGRGGWTRYELDKDIYQDIINYVNLNQKNIYIEANLSQINPKLESKFRPKAEPILSSSSGINIRNTTYTEESELPEEWEELDYEPLSSIEFKRGHIKQLYRHGNIEPPMLQESIYHYAFDLEQNNKLSQIKSDPINYFMGIMKRAGYYNAPANYEDPREKARRQYLEDQAKKAKALLEAENELIRQHFKLWEGKLSLEEKNDLVGKDEYKNNRILSQSNKLFDYFKAHLWDEHQHKLKENDAIEVE